MIGRYLLLVALSAIWGSSFLFIKVAVQTLPPLWVASGRITLAAAALLAVLRLRGGRLPAAPGPWRHFLVVALLSNAVPFALIAWGERHIDAAVAAILMATIPLATALIAHFLASGERLSPLRGAGVLAGFAGVAVLMAPAALAGPGGSALGQAAVATAALCYAGSALYYAHHLRGVAPLDAGAAILLLACAVTLPASALVTPPWSLTPAAPALAAVLVLGLLCTATAYLILFHLLSVEGATFVSLNNYLVPLFGVAWGALFLGESPPGTALAALALILAGIALSRLGLPRRA